MAETIHSVVKNVPLQLEGLVELLSGQVNTLKISDTQGAMVMVLALDKDTVVPAHTRHGDALVQLFQGQAAVQVGHETISLHQGQSVVIQSGMERSIKAVEKSRLLVTLIRSEETESCGCCGC